MARAFRRVGEGVGGTVLIANRTREIRPSGMRWGAWGNVTHGRPRIPARNRKGGAGHSGLKVYAPQFYPDGAADKAAIQQVQVLPCQLLDSDT